MLSSIYFVSNCVWTIFFLASVDMGASVSVCRAPEECVGSDYIAHTKAESLRLESLLNSLTNPDPDRPLTLFTYIIPTTCRRYIPRPTKFPDEFGEWQDYERSHTLSARQWFTFFHPYLLDHTMILPRISSLIEVLLSCNKDQETLLIHRKNQVLWNELHMIRNAVASDPYVAYDLHISADDDRKVAAFVNALRESFRLNAIDTDKAVDVHRFVMARDLVAELDSLIVSVEMQRFNGYSPEAIAKAVSSITLRLHEVTYSDDEDDDENDRV